MIHATYVYLQKSTPVLTYASPFTNLKCFLSFVLPQKNNFFKKVEKIDLTTVYTVYILIVYISSKSDITFKGGGH